MTMSIICNAISVWRADEMTKKVFVILLLISAINLIFTECAITYNLNTPMFKEFKTNILKENDKIQKIEARYYTPCLRITCILKNDATDKDIDEIFKKISQLVADPNFQKEFFDAYFARYNTPDYMLVDGKPKPTIHYPDVTVVFERPNGKRIIEYTAEYEKNGKTDYYRTWRAWDGTKIEPFKASSVDELVEAIIAAKKASDEDKVRDPNKLHELDYFYKPATAFPGYELLFIEVNERTVLFYYMPSYLSYSARKMSFDYNEGIIFAMYRDTVNSEFLQPNTGETEEIKYFSSLNELHWVQDKSRMYIRFPESFKDYDSMKVYCRAEKVVIE